MMYSKEEWTPELRHALIGKRVKHPDRRVPAKIVNTLDAPGTVILDNYLVGQRTWNLLDLRILDD